MSSRQAAIYLARRRRQETFNVKGPSGGGVAKGSGARLAARVRTNVYRRPSYDRSFTGTVKEIGRGLMAVATGKADFPIPGIGMIGAKGQVTAIARQQLARVPLAAKVVGAGTAGIATARGIEVLTGSSPESMIHDVARAVAPRLARAPGQALDRMRRHTVARRGTLAVGSELPPSHVVVKTWQTFPGGPVFAKLADGHIAVQKKDGTIKHFRPYRPVVIPRKWNARSMSRVATALKRQRKTATKIMQITGGMPKGRK